MFFQWQFKPNKNASFNEEKISTIPEKIKNTKLLKRNLPNVDDIDIIEDSSSHCSERNVAEQHQSTNDLWIDKRWECLERCHVFDDMGIINISVHCNNDSIIVLSSGSKGYIIPGLVNRPAKPSQIYIYNINQHKWIYHHDSNIPQNVYGKFISTLDKKNQILYIVNYQHPDLLLFKVDLTNNKYESFSSSTQTINGLFPYAYCSLITIKNELNIFGICPGNKHLVWSDEKKYFIHQPNLFENIPSYTEIIYLSSQKIVLMLGGGKRGDFGSKNSIYSYDIESKQFNKLNLTLPKRLKLPGCVMTRNQRYIIIFGGINQPPNPTQGSNDIYVLNTNTMHFNKSKLKCPMEGEFRAIIPDNVLKDEICVFGYIRNVWKGNEFEKMQYHPHDMIQLIREFYQNDYVHLIKLGCVANTGKHYRIKLDTIFYFN